MDEPRDRPDDLDSEAARVMRAAAEQIVLALDESNPAVRQLGDALQLLSAGLARLQGGAGDPAGIEAIRAELARAITGLQFHDRMTQHLSHVSDYLAGSADQISGQQLPGDPRWEALHRRLSPGGEIELF